MNKQESKYFHTASLMDEALLLLLEQKECDKITVNEVEDNRINSITLEYDN